MLEKLQFACSSMLVLCLLACTAREDGPRPDRRHDLLVDWGETVILPTYVDFEQRASDLESSCKALCAAPDQQALSNARSAWQQARRPFKQSEVLSFGPYKQEPIRLAPKIDFWPARVDAIEEVLSGSEPLTAQALDGMGAATKGLPVVEYLLYQPGVDVLAELVGAPRRCEYLIAASGNLASKARELREAWDPAAGNYLTQLTSAGRGSSEFATVDLALGEVVNRMGFVAENARVDKLGRPVGDFTGGVPQGDKLESRFSQRSGQDIVDNLTGVEHFMFVQQPGKLALVSLLPKSGQFESRAHQHIDAARTAVQGVEPLSTAIDQDPNGVHEAMTRLDELQTFIQVDVLGALGLSLTFNDNDGD